MKEIRLRWQYTLPDQTTVTQGKSQWFPLSADWHQVIETMKDAGNDVFGAETHWVEERPVRGPEYFWNS